MAWPHVFGNQTQANGSWLDDNFNAAVQTGSAASVSSVVATGASPGGASGPSLYTQTLNSVPSSIVSFGPNSFNFAPIAGGAITIDGAGRGVIIPGAGASTYGAVIGASASSLAVPSKTIQIVMGLNSQAPNVATFVWDSGAVGSITTTSSSTSFNTASDAALKIVHGAADGSPLSALPIRDCTFISESPEATPRPMILAQECEAMAPWAVTPGSPDGKAPCMIDYSKLVAPLIAYAQALEARIAALEAKATVAAPAASAGLVAARSALASAAALPVVQAAIARGVALKGASNGQPQAQTL